MNIRAKMQESKKLESSNHSGIEFEIPLPYVLDQTGIQHVEERPSRDGEVHLKYTRVAHAPIQIWGRYTAEDRTVLLALAWQQPDLAWRVELAPRSDVMSPSGLAKLFGKGFPSGGRIGMLVDYLSQFERANFDKIPQGRLATHLGWQADGTQFLWGNTLLSSGERRAAVFQNRPGRHPVILQTEAAGDEQLVRGFRDSGRADMWTHAMSRISKFPRVMAVAYASFVPPLLEILGVPNFAVELSSRTSTGKTTTLRIPASVWGQPDETAPNAVLRTWDATQVGVERTCALLSGLPLILDDTSLARGDAEVAKVVYLVCNARGRSRGGWAGTQQNPNFHTVLFSSGEGPISACTQKGGVRTRVLSIRGQPFGVDDESTRQEVHALRSSLLANYGHAGPEFVESLFWEPHDEIRRRYQERKAELAARTTGPDADRLVGYIACIDIAAELAHRFLRLPWELMLPGDELLLELVGHGADAAGGARALQDVFAWAMANEERFHGRRPPRGGGEALGRWDPETSGKTWTFIAFYPEALKKKLRQFGYVPDAVFQEWRERGWLRASGGNLTDKIQMCKGKNIRMVVIHRHALDEVDA